ncbi:hypothetical protein ERX46_15550 [Brumimicrobium glaciale]|uniref:Uncharacterized protein n=1 Tax=Brumimicrobium glaciale TaxID=200475 RepID=A0A4V1WF63_9FLAO|nr:hypothetical protein [Brumimicrobium glaciale]RYM32096.1 hypothetical protein ERX46_15550 [Brumimicrobium glaciale]
MRSNFLLKTLIWIILILLSVSVIPFSKSNSIWAITIYPLAYFALFYFLKRSKFWNSSKFIIITILLLYFPCLYSNGNNLGISTNLFSLVDLFSKNNFFVRFGPNLTESIKAKDTFVIFQIYSILLGTFAVLKISMMNFALVKIMRNTWESIKKNLVLISSLLIIYLIIHISILSLLMMGSDFLNYKGYNFNSALLYLGIYFLLFIIFKIFWSRNTFPILKKAITIIFILFFPMVKMSTTTIYQFTDSMEYEGLFPVMAPLGSSFENISNYLFLDSAVDPYNVNALLLIYGFVQLGFVFVLMASMKIGKLDRNHIA